MSDKNKIKKESVNKGCIQATTIVAIIVAMAWTFFIPDCSGSKKEAKSITSTDANILAIEAYNFSHDLIKKKLVSPSSAIFPKPWDIKLLSLGDDIYYIDGYVDSENGFGATIRTDFECWVFYQKNIVVRIEKINFK